MRQRLVSLLAVSCLLSPSVARAQAAEDVPRFEPADCKIGAPAGASLRCGYLVVPERRDVVDGATIRLAVAVVSGGHPTSAIPVVYLAGGPGEAGSTDLGPMNGLLDDNDWIFLDQRGTGFSEPSLACPEVPFSSAGQTVDVQHAADCAARLADWGVDLSAYTTESSAADVADLVRTLGYTQVNLYGPSYGSRLALAVERQSPELLRAVILDGVFPPQASLYADAPISFSRALRLVFDTCQADPGCRAKYPNVLGTFGHLMAQLHAQPRPIDYMDPATGQTRHATLDSRLFLEVLDVMLYVREGIAMIPALIAITDGGDYGPVGSFLPDVNNYGGAVAVGLYYAVECAEDGPRLDTPTLLGLEELPGVRQDLGFADELAQVCGVWPSTAAPARVNAPVQSDVPTLLLSGRFDPITPPEYAREAAATLPNSFDVEFAVESHVTLSSSPCSIGIARAFLSAPEQEPASACADGGDVTFVLP